MDSTIFWQIPGAVRYSVVIAASLWCSQAVVITLLAQVHITLRGLPIFGSPFEVRVDGGGPYAAGSKLQTMRAGDDRPPTLEEIETEIAATPSPTLEGARTYRV